MEGKELSIEQVWQHPIDSGLLIRDLPPRVTVDALEAYFEGKGVETERILIAPDGQSATVELTDTLSEYNVQ